MYADPDGVIRRLKLMYNKDDFYLPQLSLQAYWAAQHTDFSADNIYDDILINYSYKSRQGFKEISYIDVLQGQYNKEDLHGKIILVGVTAAGLAGNVATPLSNTHHAVHVHAQVINNILNDSFIFKVSAPQDFYINLSVVFVFLLTVFLAHKIHLLYVATTFSALLIVASIVLFKFGIWWSPLSCIIVFYIVDYMELASVFSCDRVVSSFIKQVQCVAADAQCASCGAKSAFNAARSFSV